jgi:hypothetical protein
LQPKKSHTYGRRNRPEQLYEDFQKNTERSFIRRSNLQGERGTRRSPHDMAILGRLAAKYIHCPKKRKAMSDNSSEKNRKEDTSAREHHLLS